MEHNGNLIITNDNKSSFKNLTSITGSLSIEADNASLPALTSITGSLSIKADNASLPALTSITGYLYIEADNASLPALTSITGYLYIEADNASLPALTSTGSLSIEADNASLPALTSITGYLYIKADFNVNLKQLKNKTYKSIDGKLFIIESEKRTKGLKLYTGYNFLKLENGKIIKEVCFVAGKENFFAHGETPKAAINDCLFKIIAEKIKNEPILKTTKIDINYYHTVTGSCVLGIKSWMNQYNVPEGLIAEKLLPILKKNNAYGLEKFKSLITW